MFPSKTQPQSTVHMMQAQLASMFAIQSMQDYLKYLILTTSISEGKCRPIQSQIQLLDRASNEMVSEPIIEKSPTLSPTISELETKKTSSQTPSKDSGDDTSEGSINMKACSQKSHRLWNLMVKKYSTKKIKTAKPVENQEDVEEDETYRNIDGVYIPVKKNQVTHIRRKNTCGHPNRPHYARGQCGSCYNRNGRDRKPWNCSHDRLYALGLCHKCYLLQNRLTKKDKTVKDPAESNEMKIEETPEQKIFVKQEC